MFQQAGTAQLNDYFRPLSERGGSRVFFCRIAGYGETVAAFLRRYYEAARRSGVIIDGRIFDLCKTGFLEGTLILPNFVLKELRHISDSSDALKRNRGRRGLDVLARIQQELRVPVTVDEQDFPDVEEVDVKLLKLAKLRNGCVLTTDYNLNKVAGVSGIQVLNINDLANALKPVALPGEEMEVLIVKEGKEQNQGVGYLDDGTMIVVEGGKQAIGQTVTVSVPSVLQTSAGRMIFAKMQE